MIKLSISRADAIVVDCELSPHRIIVRYDDEFGGLESFKVTKKVVAAD